MQCFEDGIIDIKPSLATNTTPASKLAEFDDICKLRTLSEMCSLFGVLFSSSKESIIGNQKQKREEHLVEETVCTDHVKKILKVNHTHPNTSAHDVQLDVYDVPAHKYDDSYFNDRNLT